MTIKAERKAWAHPQDVVDGVGCPYLFSVAQIFDLLYRGIVSCRASTTSGALEIVNAQPISNRRYSAAGRGRNQRRADSLSASPKRRQTNARTRLSALHKNLRSARRFWEILIEGNSVLRRKQARYTYTALLSRTKSTKRSLSFRLRTADATANSRSDQSFAA